MEERVRNTDEYKVKGGTNSKKGVSTLLNASEEWPIRYGSAH